MSGASTIKITSRQFALLGEDPPGIRRELVNGEVTASPGPPAAHSYADRQLTAILSEHIARQDLGVLLHDLDTVLSQLDVRQPDLVYIMKTRVHLIDPYGALQHIPDLCVEIISPTSSVIDRHDKFKQYGEAGIPHYWVLDPGEKTIQGFALRDGVYQGAGQGRGEEVVHLAPFADLAIPLGNLWLPFCV
jgi:Uma2 family endonuclease